MSDFNSSLPIRTEAAGDVIVKIADATLTGQQLAVNVDGSINTNSVVTATDLDIRDLAFATDSVDVSGSEVSLDAASLAALENITVSATNLDIRDLVFASDKVDASGSEVSLDAATLAALENITVSATNLDVRDLVFATDKVDASGSVVALDAGTLSALENITVSATDLDIRNLSQAQDSVKIGDGSDFLAINSDGSINVAITDSVAGDSVNSYNTSAALAAGASSNHDYTVTALKTLHLNQIHASASGKLKIEIQIETAAASGVFNTKFVAFNSTANPNIDLSMNNHLDAVAGAKVRIIRTNKDLLSQDVYSTISGSEV